MANTTEPNVEYQSNAVAAISTRMAHDKLFAQEFIAAAERGDQKGLHELVKTADVKLEPPEIVIIPNGVCICRGSFCICIVVRKQG